MRLEDLELGGGGLITNVAPMVELDPKTGTLRLSLHEGQQKAWLSKKRFIFVIAGTQSGKTSFGPHWLRREIDIRGPGDYLAVTANYDLFKLKMLPEMQVIFCDILKWGTYSPSERVITCKKKTNPPTRIILRSANAVSGLESSTAKGAWIDECGQDDFSIEAWEAIQRRIALNRGRVLGTTTPYNLGWLKVQVFDKFKGGDPLYDVIQFKSIQNPMFPVEEYLRAKETLPDWKWEMFYNGNFTKPSALIYSEYNDSYACDGGNLIRPFKIPAEWPRYVGIDFGPVHTALVWIAEAPRRLYMYRESLEQGTTKDHARNALEYNENVVMWLGGARSEDEVRKGWNIHGVPVIPPLPPILNNVEAGIDNVQSLFKTKRLYIFDTCERVRSELGTYSRELDAAGEPTDKIANKEKYHVVDALRYDGSAFYIPVSMPQKDHSKPPSRRSIDAIRDRYREPISKGEVGYDEYGA